jgi:cytochrome c556
MRPRWVRTSGIVLCSMLVLIVAAVAIAQTAHIMSSNPIADRQRLMKLNGASWADIQAKAKAGNIEAIAVNAETIAMIASHLPDLFPPNSVADNSNAKPEIWQDWAKFQEVSKTMETRAISLRDAAKAKDTAAVEAQVKEFGPQACGACHTPFRKPPKQ